MWEALNALFQNRILLNGLTAWAVAQVIKTIIYAVINHRIDIRRLFGDGGMPSGHSATVSATAVTSGMLYGLDSFEFAVSTILAIIVMHDASGVRLETGKQAKVLNGITDLLKDQHPELTFEEQLKEFVGHTPRQVCFGSLVGIIVAILMTM